MSNIDVFNAAYYAGTDLVKRHTAQEVLNNLKLAMQAELAKTDSFAERIVVITDTLENISNLIHGRKLLSYEEFKRNRRLIAKPLVKSSKQKGQKKVKRYKRWKK